MVVLLWRDDADHRRHFLLRPVVMGRAAEGRGQTTPTKLSMDVTFSVMQSRFKPSRVISQHDWRS